MIEIIPAIDVIGGKCVRLTQGDFDRKKEYGDPLDMALLLEDHGMKRLHLVDLDGAREKRLVNYTVLEKIAGRTSLVIDAGGGLRTDEDLRIAFGSGASLVTIGSIAARERELFLAWLEEYGSDRVILGADFREGKIAVSGWEERTTLDLMDFLGGYVEEGVKAAICTDVEKDGMLNGPSLDTYGKILQALPDLFLVASGGIGTMKDIESLDEKGIPGVIVGKAIYEELILLKDLERYILKYS